MNIKKNESFRIVNFPPELKRQAMHKAIDENISLEKLMLKAVEFYLEKNLQKK